MPTITQWAGGKGVTPYRQVLCDHELNPSGEYLVQPSVMQKGLPEWRDGSKLSEDPRSNPCTHIQSRVWWHVPRIQLLGRQRENPRTSGLVRDPVSQASGGNWRDDSMVKVLPEHT